MPREKELYRDTLERIRDRADTLYPEKLIYSQIEAARIMGCSARTLQRLGLDGFITAERLARIFS